MCLPNQIREPHVYVIVGHVTIIHGDNTLLSLSFIIEVIFRKESKLTLSETLKSVHSRRVVSCPVQPRACHWSCVFWRDFSGVKRTCWTTGSWRSCLSLEVVSSIPAGSTIIYRFLCGFICVSLCQSIKIKPTKMFIASARAQFKINTHRCWNWHLCIPDGLSVVQCSHGHVIGVAFFGAISVAWSVRTGQLAAGGVASVWRSWVRSPPGPR